MNVLVDYVAEIAGGFVIIGIIIGVTLSILSKNWTALVIVIIAGIVGLAFTFGYDATTTLLINIWNGLFAPGLDPNAP